jgi:hypothetical protein
MPDNNFGSLITYTDVEADVLDHFRLWMDTWLSARERSRNIIPGAIARPRSYIVKRTFSAFPGEEQTPIIALISDGFADPTERHGSNGTHHAFIRIGIAAIVMAGPEGQAHMIAGHYQAALVGIAIKHRQINDQVVLSAWTDLSTDDIDDEAESRHMASVRLELVYKVFNFASEFPHLTEVPPDPYQPQPDDGLVLSTHVEVVKQ